MNNDLGCFVTMICASAAIGIYAGTHDPIAITLGAAWVLAFFRFLAAGMKP